MEDEGGTEHDTLESKVKFRQSSNHTIFGLLVATLQEGLKYIYNVHTFSFTIVCEVPILGIK